MSHALLVAAIFTAYFGLMTAFGAYIWSTGRPREHRDDEDAPDRERDPGPAPERALSHRSAPPVIVGIMARFKVREACAPDA